MNKKAIYLLLFLFIAVRLNAQNDSINLLVRQEASLNVLSFLNLIPEGRERDYGFDSRSDFSQIKIEDPVQTYFVSSMNNKLTFISANEWRVPISVDGNFVSLLTVQMNNGNPEIVDFGGNKLAQKIQEFKKLYSGEAAHCVMIRNTFLNRDYVTLDFSSLYSQNDSSGLLDINVNSLNPIYQINEGQPIKTDVANFCRETFEFISESNKKK